MKGTSGADHNKRYTRELANVSPSELTIRELIGLVVAAIVYYAIAVSQKLFIANFFSSQHQFASHSEFLCECLLLYAYCKQIIR